MYGDPLTCFPEKFYCYWQLGAHSVKYGNRSLEDKNNSNEIILTGFFLKVKGDFHFLDVREVGSFAPDDPPYSSSDASEPRRSCNFDTFVAFS